MAERSRARHESSDVSGRLAGGVAILIGGVASLLALVVYALYPAAPANRPLSGSPPAWPQPSLQTDTRADMAAFGARERQWLTGYGWVDREHGIVHVPINRAMDAVVRDGIPNWPAPR